MNIMFKEQQDRIITLIPISSFAWLSVYPTLSAGIEISIPVQYSTLRIMKTKYIEYTF